ncbi:hypothetical protein QJS66_14435 [Kocuria rhizophila]|nr:hypothetical protein QJS66_14435 [Kocuria rhizophila]
MQLRRLAALGRQKIQDRRGAAAADRQSTRRSSPVRGAPARDHLGELAEIVSATGTTAAPRCCTASTGTSSMEDLIPQATGGGHHHQ